MIDYPPNIPQSCVTELFIRSQWFDEETPTMHTVHIICLWQDLSESNTQWFQFLSYDSSNTFK